MVKVELFGASGLLGWSIYQELKRRGFKTCPYFKESKPDVSFAEFRVLNLSDDSKVTRELLDLWPDAIINCAAISSPDTVNQDPVTAKRINVDAAERLAEI